MLPDESLGEASRGLEVLLVVEGVAHEEEAGVVGQRVLPVVLEQGGIGRGGVVLFGEALLNGPELKERPGFEVARRLLAGRHGLSEDLEGVFPLTCFAMGPPEQVAMFTQLGPAKGHA